MAIDRAKKNVLLLSICQALAMTGNIVLFTAAGLIGYALATDKSLATFPLAIQQFATMGSTIPASLLMKRWGRRSGFMVGVLLGLAGAVIGVYAIYASSFVLFCLATLLFGAFNGFGSFYRFAAADAASEAFRSQAIAFVVAGGIFAALVAPGLVTWSKDWLAVDFVGSLLAIIALQLMALGLLVGVDIPPPSSEERTATGRNMTAIARQPVFIVAVLASMFGYGVMALVMTATPLAMVGFSHDFGTAASVIQWHVLGMFVPSLFTGFLIARFGVLNIMLCGVLLNLACLVINLLGTQVVNFTIALLLLGVGWNLMFVGSSTLLTEAYTSEERAKTQAIHDFLMFGFVAFATFLSGRLLDRWNWATVNYAGFLMVAVVGVAVLWLMQRRWRNLPDGEFSIVGDKIRR